MIRSFRHKGLRELFLTGETARLPQAHLKKIRMILAILDSAYEVRDFRVPAFRLHRLQAPPLEGYYSIDVSANTVSFSGSKTMKPAM
ncbi:MAG: type II toxin-antitoxin system RelE/ParE family toxin [Cyclobacteriaceae bacterium]|nr:type II toxin-antitoxin system RelE/ParE family toxin [Cyclobacteriaceae bacterium]